MTVTSEAQAAALVFASNPLFGSMRQRDADAVGQSTDFATTTLDDGYGVTVTAGSGDCPAGCINRHVWTYSVSRDGQVKLVDESGDDVELTVDHGTSDPATINVRLLAGPVCPVEKNPPDPSCAPRPVAGAEVILRSPAGDEIARAVADDTGTAQFTAPGGAYYVESSEMPGYMGQATAEAFAVPGGRAVTVTLDYDTGIR